MKPAPHWADGRGATASGRRGAAPARPGLGRRARFAVLLAFLAPALGGCIPAAATTQGHDMHDLYNIFLGAGIVVVLIVWGLTTWAILRYRRRSDVLPAQTSGNNVVEALWTVVPIITVLVLFGFTYTTLSSVQAQSPDPGVRITVNAFRWQWSFQYPDQNVTVVGVIGKDPEMVVPVGEPIHVTLTAADVIHAFYVPAFLFKEDAIPGHPNTFEFTVDHAGTYRGQCAEFCGVFHAQMTFSVRAVSPAEFQQWAAGQGGGS